MNCVALLTAHSTASLCPPPADDLALRHAASQAVLRFIEGAAAATESAEAAAGGAADATEGGSLLSAAQRVLFPQLKRGLPAPNLAVRQVSLRWPAALDWLCMTQLFVLFAHMQRRLHPLNACSSLVLHSLRTAGAPGAAAPAGARLPLTLC